MSAVTFAQVSDEVITHSLIEQLSVGGCVYRCCWQLHQDFSLSDAACNCWQFQSRQVWVQFLS